jgi:periplasmic copper chaperone A
MINFAINSIAACALFTWAGAAFSHITLETKTAPPGSSYKAVLQVGHGCDGAATQTLSVQIPTGFQGAKPMPKTGWTLAVESGDLAVPYESHGKRVTKDVTRITWKAASRAAALPDAHFDQFTIRGSLHDAPGPMWFRVLQTCEKGRNDWNQVPVSGTSTQGLDFPAALLQVVQADESAPPAGAAPAEPVQVSGAWVRTAVKGQQGTGAFMKLTARSNLRLTGASSPAAGVAEIHEMKMEGDVMKMRAVSGVDLATGQTLELKPGGFHLMLLDLKQPLAAGSTVSVTLVLKDATGAEIRQELKLPVSATPPPGASAAGAVHKH